ncbi:MAG TPA: tonB-system energizer ExbB [Paenirhodobacter sp.]
MTQSDQKQHRPQRLISIAALVVAGQVLAAAPIWAQGVPTQDTATSPTTTVAPLAADVPPAPTATAPVGTAPTGAESTTAVPAQTVVPATGDAAVAADPATADPVATDPAAQPGAVPSAVEVPAVAPVIEEPQPEPMPNVFADPAGAVTHIMSRSTHPSGTLPHDLSPWGMFRQADIVVKVVMLGLAFASLVTWTVFIAKTIELSAAKRRARATLMAVHGARTLHEAIVQNGDRRGPAGLMLRAARTEVETSEPVLDFAGGDGVKERVDAALRRIEAGAGRKVSVGTGILATIGSTAPFVGLFGTVWGIMNAFIGISKSQTTNLAVVAPGIAEALLATAIGLVAAIPAVILYNHFARTIARYRQILSDAGVGVEILVSRDLDFRKVPQADIVRARQAAE